MTDQPVILSADAGSLTVRVPLRVRRKGGRKLIVTPADQNPRSQVWRPDDTILKALGRAHRWKRMLESGDYSSITDLAAAEKISHSYVRRILRLTLLSPELIEALLDGSMPRHLRLEDLSRRLPAHWSEQRELLAV